MTTPHPHLTEFQLMDIERWHPEDIGQQTVHALIDSVRYFRKANADANDELMKLRAVVVKMRKKVEENHQEDCPAEFEQDPCDCFVADVLALTKIDGSAL